MNENESLPTPFHEFMRTRIINDQSAKGKALYKDWSHANLNLTEMPRFDLPRFPRSTSISNAHVFLMVPVVMQIPSSQSHTSGVMFWSKTDDEAAPESHDGEFTKAVHSLYQSYFTELRLSVSVNPKQGDLQRVVSHHQQGDITKRTLIHFIANNSHDCQLPLFFQSSAFLDLLKATSNCGVHIIDCDFAGKVMQRYADCLSERNDCGYETDFFAFFACSEAQRLPRNSGVPLDIFSSCLLSPAKTALLWQSSHYFCFKSDALLPLSIEDINSAPKEIIDSVMIYLKKTVEAMVAEQVVEKRMSEAQYLELFKADDAVSDLVVGFILACHILDFFNITPLSIPELPNLTKHSLWFSVELKLDAAVVEISTAVHNGPDFWEQELQSVQLLLKSNAVAANYLSHVNFLSQAVLEPNLRKESCEALCKFMDMGRENVRICAMFSIFPSLVSILNDGCSHPSLLLCLARLIPYTANAQEIMNEMVTNKDVVMRNLESEKPLFALIMLAFYVKDNSTGQRVLLSSGAIKRVLQLLRNSADDVRLWSVLLMSQVVPAIDDDTVFTEILEHVLDCVNDEDPIVRTGVMFCLKSFTQRSRAVDENITARICHLEHDLHPCVRCELVSLLSFIFQANRCVSMHNDMMNRIISVISPLTIDSYPMVCQLAIKFINSIPEERSVIAQTYSLDWFLSTIYAPIMDLSDSDERIDSRQSTIFESDDDTDPEIPRLAFTSLKRGVTLELDQPISSNFVFTSNNEVMYGTHQGSLCSLQWNQQQKPCGFSLTGSAITCLQFLPNSGFNLLLAANNVGDLFTVTRCGSNWSMISGFKISNESKAKHILFDCDIYNRRLFSYIRGDQRVKVFDLTCERMIGSIDSESVASVRSVRGMDNVVGVCGASTVALYDTRASTMERVLSIESQGEIFDGGQVANDPITFAVCCNDGSISCIDWRKEDYISHIRPRTGSFKPLCFATHSASYTCAVGHTLGAVIQSTSSVDKYIDFPLSSLFAKMARPVKSIQFHPQKFSVVLTQNSSDVVTLVEYV